MADWSGSYTAVGGGKSGGSYDPNRQKQAQYGDKNGMTAQKAAGGGGEQPAQPQGPPPAAPSSPVTPTGQIAPPGPPAQVYGGAPADDEIGGRFTPETGRGAGLVPQGFGGFQDQHLKALDQALLPTWSAEDIAAANEVDKEQIQSMAGQQEEGLAQDLAARGVSNGGLATAGTRRIQNNAMEDYLGAMRDNRLSMIGANKADLLGGIGAGTSAAGLYAGLPLQARQLDVQDWLGNRAIDENQREANLDFLLKSLGFTEGQRQFDVNAGINYGDLINRILGSA